MSPIKDPDKTPVIVNQILGKEAALGGLIPTSHLLPWAIIILISYIISIGFLNLGMPTFGGISLWLMISWSIVVGNQPHHFINKFQSRPGTDWYNGHLLYVSPIPENRPPSIRTTLNDSQRRGKLPPLKSPNQYGTMKTYIPFQNFSDAVCLVEIQKDQYKTSGILLNKGTQYQLVFPFRTPGYHNLLHPPEITNTLASLEEGLKEFPPGEKITVHCGCYSNDKQRQYTLSKQADNCQVIPISILTRNKQKRVQELTSTGIRQIWDKIIFCTWTYNSNTGSRSNDWLTKTIRAFSQFFIRAINWFTGNSKQHQEIILKDLLIKAFDQGFMAWNILLETKFELEVQPCSAQDLWEWLWYEFNDSPPPPIPQLLCLTKTEMEDSLQELINSNKDLSTVLIEGVNGRSACPEHRDSGDCIWLPGRNQKCAILTLESRPKMWNSQREQLNWLWTILSKPYTHDTKIVAELSSNPISEFFVADNLAKYAKQSKLAQERAAEKGQGRDVAAELNAEESFEAQKKIHRGAKSVYCAIALLVFRPDDEQLNLACQKISLSFGAVKVIRERHITWQLWLETLPLTLSWLMHTSSNLSERRQIFDSETAPATLPLTEVRNIDSKGIEIITQGGKPVYIDLFHDQISRALITGEAGSGKSLFGWEFITDALANNIPVLGIDISPANGSTFEQAIQLLGEQGAYYQMVKTASNLMEIPDLRSFTPQERKLRMQQWCDTVRKALNWIAMGKLNDHDPKLAQRVDSINIKTLKHFLSDPDIIERYNLAFENGWKSSAWQNIPLLKDFRQFCTLQQLDIQNPEDIDKAAINQIQTQIDTLLNSPLGQTLGRPSSFSPNPMIKFFSLGGISNEQDLHLMALSTHAAVIRNALSHPVSLFVGDELSVLLTKDGYAEAIGELCAIGRKNGIAVILLTQDIDSIYHCSTGSQILQNMVYRITGRLTINGVKSWISKMKYPETIIYQNASDSFVPKQSEIYSSWLIEKNNRFWQGRYYPGEMTLASVVNNPAEIQARTRILSQYPPTLRGQMQGLKDFTEQYITALKQGRPISSIQSQDYHFSIPSLIHNTG